MPAGIFISYRRQEALKEARAIFEKLSREFGAGQVFIDLEGLDYGVDFVESLERQLQHCQVMLVLIGPGWVAAPDGHGGRRLDDANDFVRIELRAALQRNIRVVPVLFDGAPMPRTADLPADLEPLARRNKIDLDFHRFDADIGRLIGSLRKILVPEPVADPEPTAEPVPVPTPLTEPIGLSSTQRAVEEATVKRPKRMAATSAPPAAAPLSKEGLPILGRVIRSVWTWGGAAITISYSIWQFGGFQDTGQKSISLPTSAAASVPGVVAMASGAVNLRSAQTIPVAASVPSEAARSSEDAASTQLTTSPRGRVSDVKKVVAPKDFGQLPRTKKDESVQTIAPIRSDSQNRQELRPPNATQQASAQPIDPFVYFVQVSAFPYSEDAEKLRLRLTFAGIDTRITEREQNGRILFRVRAGPFEYREDAEKSKIHLIDLGYPEATLVRVNR
ncbi:MAG TPA: TIR domain-containing protein [Burkholderiaceae bacterium]|nr:TIR domain-containing protein [Burkholderiaceae bacterium]HMY99974.1 TIR domain-containing protein [Burkholderiaceae bacterium]HNB44832.1 TIR domain-containing protein [Burkholderiaceae bacterium]HNG79543.1 TIR domain-containing protein [Burkholderiaceae bacterium]